MALSMRSGRETCAAEELASTVTKKMVKQAGIRRRMADPFDPGRREGFKVGLIPSTITEGEMKSSVFWIRKDPVFFLGRVLHLEQTIILIGCSQNGFHCACHV